MLSNTMRHYEGTSASFSLLRARRLCFRRNSADSPASRLRTIKVQHHLGCSAKRVIIHVKRREIFSKLQSAVLAGPLLLLAGPIFYQVSPWLCTCIPLRATTSLLKSLRASSSGSRDLSLLHRSIRESAFSVAVPFVIRSHPRSSVSQGGFSAAISF